MSIVVGLRLTEDSGLIAADRSYSYRGRTVKHEDKVFPISGKYLLGFTGDLTLRDPVLKNLKQNTETGKDMPDVLKAVEDAYLRQRNSIFYGGPLRVRGYTQTDWENRGKDQATLDREQAELEAELSTLAQRADLSFVERTRIKKIQKRLAEPPKPILSIHLEDLEHAYSTDTFEGRPITEGDFILVGQNKQAGLFEIHRISFPGSAIDMGYFDVIGPSSSRETVHRASKAVIGYTLDVESIGGRHISLAEGGRIALSVVREGWAERGIGGKTQLVLVQGGDKIIEYKGGRTTYMHNLLELEKEGRLSTDHVSRSLQQVMESPETFDDAVAETVNTVLGSKTTEKARRFLIHHFKHNIIIADEFRNGF